MRDALAYTGLMLVVAVAAFSAGRLEGDRSASFRFATENVLRSAKSDRAARAFFDGLATGVQGK